MPVFSFILIWLFYVRIAEKEGLSQTVAIENVIFEIE